MKAFLIVKYKDVIGEILSKGTPFDMHMAVIISVFRLLRSLYSRNLR